MKPKPKPRGEKVDLEIIQMASEEYEKHPSRNMAAILLYLNGIKDYKKYLI